MWICTVFSFGVESMAEVVSHGRLRWFGQVEHKIGDDWVSAGRNVMVAGVRCVGRGRKTWRECVKDDMDELGLHSEYNTIQYNKIVHAPKVSRTTNRRRGKRNKKHHLSL